MTIFRQLPLLLLIVTVATFSGCAMFNKGTYSKTTTIGQELIDLKTARDNDVLSDEEYKELKKEIIKNNLFKSNYIDDE